MNRPLPAVAGVMGWPVAQSKSPLIHRFWLSALKMDGDYSRFAVTPESLGQAILALPSLGLRGVNVTVPHKIAVMEYLDHIEPAAREIGAVNTVVVRENGLVGANTDVAGFLEPLAAKNLEGEHAVVLGAGGAARAVLAGLRQRQIASVTLVVRNMYAGEELLEQAGISGKVQDFASSLPGDCCLLVNATSLGMQGKPALDVDLSPLRSECAVYDLVYAPLSTGLLQAARRHGLTTIDGLSMLIGQADHAFRKFFEAVPPRSRDAELRSILTCLAP
ncbi:MAG: shikimate dehydrogenase [Sphingomonadaceae bacterium]